MYHTVNVYCNVSSLLKIHDYISIVLHIDSAFPFYHLSNIPLDGFTINYLTRFLLMDN